MKWGNDNRAICFIPARLNSKRFPRKAMHKINGKRLISRVFERALMCKIIPNLYTRFCFTEVYVTSSDQEILDLFPNNSIKTEGEFKNGTERICEAIKSLDLNDNDIVVNIQGDMPFFSPGIVRQLLMSFNEHDKLVATVASPLMYSDAYDPNTVKVFINSDSGADTFSRGVNRGMNPHKHVGVYAYRVSALKQYETLLPSVDEKLEQLEQLRFTNNGIDIHVETINQQVISIDCEKDLEF